MLNIALRLKLKPKVAVLWFYNNEKLELTSEFSAQNEELKVYQILDKYPNWWVQLVDLLIKQEIKITKAVNFTNQNLVQQQQR